jgi:hypothetical protein
MSIPDHQSLMLLLLNLAIGSVAGEGKWQR